MGGGAGASSSGRAEPVDEVLAVRSPNLGLPVTPPPIRPTIGPGLGAASKGRLGAGFERSYDVWCWARARGILTACSSSAYAESRSDGIRVRGTSTRGLGRLRFSGAVVRPVAFPPGASIGGNVRCSLGGAGLLPRSESCGRLDPPPVYSAFRLLRISSDGVGPPLPIAESSEGALGRGLARPLGEPNPDALPGSGGGGGGGWNGTRPGLGIGLGMGVADGPPAGFKKDPG